MPAAMKRRQMERCRRWADDALSDYGEYDEFMAEMSEYQARSCFLREMRSGISEYCVWFLIWMKKEI